MFSNVLLKGGWHYLRKITLHIKFAILINNTLMKNSKDAPNVFKLQSCDFFWSDCVHLPWFVNLGAAHLIISLPFTSGCMRSLELTQQSVHNASILVGNQWSRRWVENLITKSYKFVIEKSLEHFWNFSSMYYWSVWQTLLVEWSWQVMPPPL